MVKSRIKDSVATDRVTGRSISTGLMCIIRDSSSEPLGSPSNSSYIMSPEDGWTACHKKKKKSKIESKKTGLKFKFMKRKKERNSSPLVHK